MRTAHLPTCRWEQTTSAECEYKATHFYCPHPEHACTCIDAKLAEEHIFQFFSYSHLPPHLQDVSRPFQELAHSIILSLPRNPERTVALRKLLEAKDAAVRALIAK